MKTPEEILYSKLIEGKSDRMKKFIRLVDREAELAAMQEYAEAYHFQFEGECEWVMLDGFENTGSPQCNKTVEAFILYRDSKYCPFCGCKIKRV